MANRWGEQLACLKCFDHAVLDELPGQLVLRVQDLAFVVQAFDLETCLAPQHAVGQPVGTGDDKDAAGLAGQYFAFLDQELDVLGFNDHQHGDAVAMGIGLFVHRALHM